MHMNRPVVRDGALLILRIIVGGIFIAHGIDKVFMQGMDETVGQFSAWGVPSPQLWGWVIALGEIIGGAVLVVGLLTTVVAAVMAFIPAAGIYYVHASAGVFAEDGGIEFPALLIVSLIMVIVFGAGRASLDGVLNRAIS